jgi:uncharacterized protein (TIGR03435 family)
MRADVCYEYSTVRAVMMTVMGIAAIAAPAGQAPATFAAASIRQSLSGGSGAGFQIFPGGQFRATNATARQLVQAAYDFAYERFQIVGGPSWIDVDRFDVQATPAADGQAGQVATPQEIAVRIQALLAERFKLVMRREMREMQRFDLVVARPGRMTANAGTCAPRGPAAKPEDDARPYCGLTSPPEDGGLQQMVAAGVTIEALARRLQGTVEAIVVDRTGLEGGFDFTLKYLPRNIERQLDAGTGVSIFTAVQEQLGLRLEPTRGSVEVVVIDGVERPTEN